MSVLPIQQGSGNPILRGKAKKVGKVTKAVQKLIADMVDTVRDEDGAGIAAPQVGHSLKLCLALVEGKMTLLINPEISSRSAEMEIQDEGCLSLPGLTVPVPRAVSITVRYQNEKGVAEERRLSGFSARTVQHEVDHLQGILIADYLKP